ncbi:MAG: hypothetical protein RIT35_454, partial [Pseudomonadota bacterium]
MVNESEVFIIVEGGITISGTLA